MLAYVEILLQCVMLCYSVGNSKYTACGGRSSVTLILLLAEDPASVLLRPVGPTIKIVLCLLYIVTFDNNGIKCYT
jgi:hypothetical protein